MRSSSLKSDCSFKNSGSFHAIGWRVGASKLPSRAGALAVGLDTQRSFFWLKLGAGGWSQKWRAHARGPWRQHVPHVEARQASSCPGLQPPRPPAVEARLRLQRVERLLEAIRVRTLRLRERLEPVCDLVESFFACLLRHAGIHVRVLVRLARDRGLQVRGRIADRQTRGGIANGLEILEVPVG